MKKMFTLLSAGALFAASAATLSTTSGTTFAGLTAGDAFSASEAAAEGGKYYWYSADAQSGTNMSLAANYYGGACGRPNQFAEAETSIALAVDAENILYRAAEGSASRFSSPSFTQVDLGDGGLYIDTLIKFEQCRDEADIADDTGKLAIWLNSTSNLVVTAGQTVESVFSTNDYTTAATYNPEAWYRLTVKSFMDNGDQKFNVYIDGASVTAGGVTDFPSLVPTATQLSALAFQGVGSVDDISFTEALPNFLGAAKIGDIFYATLADALAAVNVGQTVTIITDPGVSTLAFPMTGITISDPNGYLSGATVTGPDGQTLTPSGNTYIVPITTVNPVTGETEEYTWKFVGTDTWNGTGNWQGADGNHPSGTPAKSGENVWDPILFDGNTINIAAGISIEGWNLRMGLYNGANVRMNTFVKWQGDTTMWATVDGTSKLTIGGFGKGNISANQVIKLSSACANGIEWLVNLESEGTANNTFEYYLVGAGSVSYQGVTACDHKIKMADVTLSGSSEKSIQSKTLVSFTSTDKTFTADATVKVKNSLGSNVGEETVFEVKTGATTLTTDDRVGACELVQTSTGIVLYYVDGETYEPKTYKPSINLNFTHEGAGINTRAEIGLAGYAVPGGAWNNIAGENGTTSSTIKKIDSTGTVTVDAGVSVAVSNTRGSYRCNNLASATDLRHGYIDENSANATPTVTITGIPYANYRVIVYHATDSANYPFGYDTINDVNFTYVNGVQTVGTDSWGDSGAYDGADAIAEGVNTLVSGILSGSTITMVAHRIGGGTATARGCFAAIQIVEVAIGANDLIIPVNGDTTYTVSESGSYENVYVVGQGTLTLDGSGTITAGRLEIDPIVTVEMNEALLSATTVVGSGTVVYNGVVPPTGKGWTDSAWTGIVWIKNKSGITGNNNATTGVQPNSLGNASSKVKFSGVSGWLEAPVTYIPEIVLENDGYDYALQLTNGNSPNDTYVDRCTEIKVLSGSGTLSCGGSSTATPTLKVYDSSNFTGSIDTGTSGTGLVVVFCEEGASLPDTLRNMFITSNLKRSIYVASNTTVTATGTWTANTGFCVYGTLNVNGSIASSASSGAVRGTGTVVFTGRGPTVSGNAWWKDSSWTGALKVKSVTNLIGTSGSGTYIDFNECGNSGSVIELDSVSGWINPAYTCNVPLKITNTLALNNGYSNKANAFKVGTLLGNGTISGSGSAPQAVFNVTTDWSGFTGNIGLDNKCVVFGETIPDTITQGQIYISEGAVVTNNVASGTWWAEGGIKVDGELCAPNLGKFGDGTNITTGDNGVFTLTSTGNGTEGETETNYARIQGTGWLKYEGAGWRALSTNNLSTVVGIIDEQGGDILLSRALTYNIGSLSGTKNFQGNYGSGSRYLNILQSRDSEWSGKVVDDGYSRLAGFKLDSASTGTLTLSGTATQGVPLEVNGGAVNLTGTWKGATTVAGTFGGTGTLTGNLTFSDGATFKAFASDENGLSVSGTITYPSGTVTVDVSALGASAKKVVLLTAASESDIDLTKFALADGTPSKYKLAKEGATLVLKGARKGVFIGVY